ncbi:hypothetical protein [Streptomyces sp. WAC 06738]|uniref:hypothetical protein n=1 Tax=Streptomyces sp. WAC 06738 TaxID=2203210 RepID=UPI001F0BBF5D|nr:hypothetical protein [Streptomyces sp. WAC 06738]
MHPGCRGVRHEYRDGNARVRTGDGRPAYGARVPVAGFHAGMTLFSARDLARYSRAERERGQGATGCWSPRRITASDR